ncbi:MAG: riboflavin biosynthesis protein RibF [Chthoniobacterales bacterium]|nr:riboflavin biosynthesis protein RibF [Chthoniobacterales bacterium]
MILYQDIDNFLSTAPPCVLAAGVFDGVHLGHRSILNLAIQISSQIQAIPGVLTFNPHPVTVLCNPSLAPPLITPREQKLELLAKFGAKLILEIPFDPQLAATPWNDFLTKITSTQKVRGICAGENWTFGSERKGNMAHLQSIAQQFNLIVTKAPFVHHDGIPISSTRIRQAILSANFSLADTLLGRPHTIRLNIIRGAQLGRQIGFPTANLPADNYALPPDGVYAAFARPPHSHWLPAVANIGLRPTIDPHSKHRLLEVHILNFSREIYDKPLEIRFVQKIRNEIKFASLDQLRTQIAEDCLLARKILEQLPSPNFP